MATRIVLIAAMLEVGCGQPQTSVVFVEYGYRPVYQTQYTYVPATVRGQTFTIPSHVRNCWCR